MFTSCSLETCAIKGLPRHWQTSSWRGHPPNLMIWEDNFLTRTNTAPRTMAAMPTSTLTVRDVIALYLRHSKANGLHCQQALAERESLFALFNEATFGDPPVKIVDLDVDNAKAYHLSDWIDANEGWKSVATRRAKANMIRAAFEWAAEQERITRNPFRKVRYAESERRPNLPDDVLETVEHLANKKFEIALRFLRLTGCRLSELSEATWAGIDFEHGVWTIHRHKSKRYTGKAKSVALVAEAVWLLQKMAIAAAKMPNATFDTARMAPIFQQTIFTNNRGTAWNRRTLGQSLSRIKVKFNIKTRASLHGVRHTAATEALANGASPVLVSEQLGHASPAITFKYYWHPDADHVQQIRQAFEKGIRKDSTS